MVDCDWNPAIDAQGSLIIICYYLFLCFIFLLINYENEN